MAELIHELVTVLTPQLCKFVGLRGIRLSELDVLDVSTEQIPASRATAPVSCLGSDAQTMLGMELEVEAGQTSAQLLQAPVRLRPVLEPDDEIVGVAHDDHPSRAHEIAAPRHCESLNLGGASWSTFASTCSSATPCGGAPQPGLGDRVTSSLTSPRQLPS